jgi:adhesin transport system membrane fusion protein
MTQQGRVVTHLLLWVTVFTVAAFVAWSQWASLDQITRATGQVITTSRNQVIQAPPNGGMLDSIRVREGDTVSRGQILMRFERIKLGASHEEAATKAAALRAQIARLEAEILDQREPAFAKDLAPYPEFRANQMALFRKRRLALDEDIRTLESMRELAQQELDMNLPLMARGDVARSEILKLQRQVAELAGQISSKRNKFLQDSQADLAKAQEELSGTLQVITQRRQELDLADVRSPMDGVVRNVRMTTVGGVARPGDELMQIVPVDDRLVIEAKVKPADIGFIRTGLPVVVKLDAYDYSIYGTLLGHTSFVSADTLTEQIAGQELPYYRVHVTIDTNNLRPRNGERLEVQPGMTASVEIRTGEKTVWRYLTKPITKALDESLRER